MILVGERGGDLFGEGRMARQQKSESLKLRCEPELRDRLIEAAVEQRRPVANLLRLIVSDWLAEHAGERRAAA